MLTTSFQISKNAIQKHVQEGPLGRWAQLMEKEQKLPLVTQLWFQETHSPLGL